MERILVNGKNKWKIAFQVRQTAWVEGWQMDSETEFEGWQDTHTQVIQNAELKVMSEVWPGAEDGKFVDREVVIKTVGMTKILERKCVGTKKRTEDRHVGNYQI